MRQREIYPRLVGKGMPRLQFKTQFIHLRYLERLEVELSNAKRQSPCHHVGSGKQEVGTRSQYPPVTL